MTFENLGGFSYDGNYHSNYDSNYDSSHDSSKVEKRNPLYKLAENIINSHEFIILENKKIYFYTDGYYRNNGDIVIRKQARKKGYEWITNSQINEIISIISDTVGYEQNDYFAAGTHNYKVCIKNGVLDLEKGVLLQHDKKYKFTSKLPLYYDISKKCPLFAKFLRTSLDADPIKVTTVLEMMGHTLIRDNTKISKIFLHVGKGSNGKSILFGILQKMLGNFYSSKTIHSFSNSSFAGAELIGKHANICADIGSTEIKETDLLKRASAGDAIDCEEKYKAGFPAIPYATMIFSANELPDIKDESDGFTRRIEVIEWERSFYGKEKDIKVTQISNNSDEISGILNMLIPITRYMIQRGELKYQRSLSEIKMLYKLKSDSVYLFAQSELVDGAENMIITTEIYSVFVKFCKTKSFRIINDQSFSRKMKERGYIKERKKVNGKINYYWFGTTLRDNLTDDNQSML